MRKAIALLLCAIIFLALASEDTNDEAPAYRFVSIYTVLTLRNDSCSVKVLEVLEVQPFIPCTKIIREYPNDLTYNQQAVSISDVVANSTDASINSTKTGDYSDGRAITINFNGEVSNTIKVTLSFEVTGILFSNSAIIDTLNWIYTSESSIGKMTLNVSLPSYTQPYSPVKAKPEKGLKNITSTYVAFEKILLGQGKTWNAAVFVPSTCRIVDFDKQMQIGVGIGVSLAGVLAIIIGLFFTAEIWNYLIERRSKSE
jgi:hypothetical protein